MTNDLKKTAEEAELATQNVATHAEEIESTRLTTKTLQDTARGHKMLRDIVMLCPDQMAELEKDFPGLNDWLAAKKAAQEADKE